MPEHQQLKAFIKTLKTDRILEASNGTGITINGSLFDSQPTEGIRTNSLKGSVINNGIKIEDVHINNSSISTESIKPFDGKTIEICDINVDSTRLYSKIEPIFINGTRFRDKEIHTNKINSTHHPVNISGVTIENGIIKCKNIISETPLVPVNENEQAISDTDIIEKEENKLIHVKEDVDTVSILNTVFRKGTVETLKFNTKVFETDAIFEKTKHKGVTIEGCLLKNSNIISNGDLSCKTGNFEKLKLGHEGIVIQHDKWVDFDIPDIPIKDNKSKYIHIGISNTVHVSFDFKLIGTLSKIKLPINSPAGPNGCVYNGTIFLNDRPVIISAIGKELIINEISGGFSGVYIRGSITYGTGQPN
tara:strand:+ start:14135 stop:15220 length:1086 start_codon:yes stop_codon:yes gene_type:complete